MGLARQAGAAVILVAVTLWLQCAGMGVLIHWTRTIIERSTKKLSPWHSAVLMVRFAAAMIVLQILEILVWGCFYHWKCLSLWEASFYFSAASYTTLGYGDVLLPQIWRSLGPVEGLTGMLMCGMSVSGLFAVLTRILAAEASVSAPLHNPLQSERDGSSPCSRSQKASRRFRGCSGPGRSVQGSQAHGE
jgi:voltage-gated potassium channel